MICCIDAFRICPIVAVYGLLWYLNSIYGIILMIVESQNVCFFEWCGVCIVNTAIPIVWLLIISMVDSCCIRVYSLKKWHRRHYGAAFWYFVCKCIQQTQVNTLQSVITKLRQYSPINFLYLVHYVSMASMYGQPSIDHNVMYQIIYYLDL